MTEKEIEVLDKACELIKEKGERVINMPFGGSKIQSGDFSVRSFRNAKSLIYKDVTLFSVSKRCSSPDDIAVYNKISEVFAHYDQKQIHRGKKKKTEFLEEAWRTFQV
jgi:hypothetical protein